MRSCLLTFCALGLLTLSAGCSVTMEDGYKPRLLNDTGEVRRAYYASPFTDQADAANRPRGEEGPRRPVGQ